MPRFGLAALLPGMFNKPKNRTLRATNKNKMVLLPGEACETSYDEMR